MACGNSWMAVLAYGHALCSMHMRIEADLTQPTWRGALRCNAGVLLCKSKLVTALGCHAFLAWLMISSCPALQ